MGSPDIMTDLPSPDLSLPDLASLRAEIDSIDDAVHDLLMRRAALSARMAASRVKNDSFPYRPGREAGILRRLLARHHPPIPAGTMVQVWREIIAASLLQQGPLSLAVLQPQRGNPGESPLSSLARAHYGEGSTLRLHATVGRVLAALSAGEANLAILPMPDDGDLAEAAWWLRLEAPRLHVVAALPFLAAAGQRPQALVVAAMAPEATGRDRSLLRLAHAPDMSRDALAAALSAAGLKVLRLIPFRDLPHPHETGAGRAADRGAEGCALAEIEGFLSADDPRLKNFRADLLGAYAEPESLP
ncbi:hypothetical protein APZ41_016075 [Roseomonas mucosa]|uniref:chorismate mutase n=2 Tax=Roseomonas mucosa TaxID=207340 RepID=A0A1S8D3Z6_9PROT|nr:hypothetical protein APZ41_016075 [Roseomonas mucosa]